MFGDYTDPYDIDTYYGEVGKIFTKIADYKDPTAQITQAVPDVPAQVEQPSTQPVTSKFEVVPNSIFIDDHPVGAHPQYNILQSAGPDKETYRNYPGYNTHCNQYPGYGHIYLFMIIILFILVIYIAQLHSRLHGHDMIIHMLLSEIVSKKKIN